MERDDPSFPNSEKRFWELDHESPITNHHSLSVPRLGYRAKVIVSSK